MRYARGDANHGGSCSSTGTSRRPRRTAANSESTRRRNPSSTTCGDSSRTVASGTPRRSPRACDARVDATRSCVPGSAIRRWRRRSRASRGFASRYVPSGENRSSRRRDSRGFIRRWIRPSSRRVTSRRARPGVARDRCVSRRARTRGGTRTRGWTPRGGDATGSRRTSPGRCFARRDGERMVIGETTSRRATVTRATMIAYRRRRIVPR